MEKIKHEGKTYLAVPATCICNGCAFLKRTGEEVNCTAPDGVTCAGTVFKECDDDCPEYPIPDDLRLALKAILAAFVIVVMVVGTVALVAHIIIRNYELGVLN